MDDYERGVRDAAEVIGSIPIGINPRLPDEIQGLGKEWLVEVRDHIGAAVLRLLTEDAP